MNKYTKNIEFLFSATFGLRKFQKKEKKSNNLEEKKSGKKKREEREKQWWVGGLAKIEEKGILYGWWRYTR